MKLSRPSRFVAALIALISVLFTQLAVAAYACPSLQAGPDARPALIVGAEPDEQTMPDCAEMDMEQPALCHAHAQVGDQSLDKPASPHLFPSAAILLVPAAGTTGFAYRPVTAYTDSPFLAWTSPPSLSIRHCCFRI